MYFVTDWAQRVNFERMRAYRVQRTRDAMATYGLDAILAFEYANTRYIAGLRPLWAPNFLLRQAAIITRASDEVICFVHLDDTPHRRSTMYWMKPENVREFPTAVVNQEAPAAALEPLATALRDLGFSGGRIGVDIATVSALRNLERLLGDVELVDLGPCMQQVRMVKNEDELELMREASSIVDIAMETAVRSATTGVRECEVLAEVMRVFYRFGAEIPQCNLIVCTGPNTAPMQRFAGDRLIAEGDLVFMDIGACFNGVFSEATRTIVNGRPNATQRAIYRTVHEIHERTIAALHPGASSVDVQAAADEPYRRSDYVGYMQKMIIAHGIGVGYAESPFIAPPGSNAAPLTLEPGMTLAVVPTIIVPDVPGGGGVRLEDIVVVGKDGPQQLTRAPYDARLLE
ncbi:MAG: aminopeptidase P family protein [Chloroflexi bacterium]|nr:aminopeptidase P family protein [Chloroflexota bacterium]